MPPITTTTKLAQNEAAAKPCAKGDEITIMDQGSNLIGLARCGNSEDLASGLVCLISNDMEDRLLPMQMPSQFCGRRFHCLIGDSMDVAVSDTGKAVFHVRANRCAIFVPEDASNRIDVNFNRVLQLAR